MPAAVFSKYGAPSVLVILPTLNVSRETRLCDDLFKLIHSYELSLHDGSLSVADKAPSIVNHRVPLRKPTAACVLLIINTSSDP